jgi:hypothetical protein
MAGQNIQTISVLVPKSPFVRAGELRDVKHCLAALFAPWRECSCPLTFDPEKNQLGYVAKVKADTSAVWASVLSHLVPNEVRLVAESPGSKPLRGNHKALWVLSLSPPPRRTYTAPPRPLEGAHHEAFMRRDEVRRLRAKLIPALQTSLTLSASLVHEDASCRPSVSWDEGCGA